MSDTLDKRLNEEYKFGFESNVDMEVFAKGLNEEVIRKISEKKEEPRFLLDFRLKAYHIFKKMTEPHWGVGKYDPIDYSAVSYFAAPKKQSKKNSLDEVDPEVLKTFDRLGISLSEQKRISGVAVDAVFDSVSVGTTHQDVLAEVGVIFCSFSEAAKDHPDLVEKYLGTVVPISDNFFAALNSAVFTDGSFGYIPKGVKCPLDLSTYFRINASETGQFERTLVIADDGASTNYLEGCTAPMRDENQLHAAVVELVALEEATINYSTVQNWYAGNEEGKGGIYNFVTKRGKCLGKKSYISWVQVEAGAAITWKYPSCLLIGDDSAGSFYSVALTNHHMQADTGSKMIHIGKRTKSTIISKGISANQSINAYRGRVEAKKTAEGARNFSQCDSLLIGAESAAHTFPNIKMNAKDAHAEHEATTSKIGEENLFYLESRGLAMEQAVSLVVGGFCQDVFKKLPMEFSVEAVKLIELKLENSIG